MLTYRVRMAGARPLVCALVVLVAGCGATRQDPASLRSNTVIVGVKDREDSLLPDFLSDAQFLACSPLATIGSDGELEPRLALSWDISADGRVWTWHLRDDARWHDGQPVTAHDVKFTLDLISQPDVLYSPPFNEITVIDDLTVRISNGDHDYGTYVVIYPKHVLGDLDPARFWQWDFWTHPVGSGPYRFLRYAPNRFMELEANPDYFMGKPRIDKVTLKFIGDAAAVEALASNVDVVSFSDGRTARALERDERFRLHHGLYEWALGLYFNHRHPLFSDSRVRRAVALALDRPAILEAIGLPRELPLTDVLYSPRQFRRKQLPAPLPYDPEAAQGLLDEAGWLDVDGDGVREQGSSKARFSLFTWGSGEREVLIQDYLGRIGLTVEIHSLDLRVKAQRIEEGEFDGGVHVLQPAPWWQARYFGEKSVVGYRNRRVADALRQATETADLDALDSLYVGIQEEFARDMPFVILQPITTTYAVHKRVRGLNAPMFRGPMEQMADLWIEAE